MTKNSKQSHMMKFSIWVREYIEMLEGQDILIDLHTNVSKRFLRS